jgi:hypothetical protein
MAQPDVERIGRLIRPVRRVSLYGAADAGPE